MSTQQTRRRGRSSVYAVALTALVLAATTACAQPGLERLARDLDRSVPRTPDVALEGKIDIRFTGVEVKNASTRSFPFPVASADFVVAPGAGKQALLGPDGRAALTDHRIVYARRKLNGPADHRPWVRLEVERLDDVEVPRLESLLNQQDTGVLVVITPGFVIDAMRGVLTGSIKHRRLDDGRRVFDFNVSLDKAERELDKTEDERDDAELLRRSIALTGDLYAATATLRPDGSLAEVVLHLVEHPDKRSRVKLDVRVTVAPPISQQLWPPKRENTIRVGTLAAVRGNLVEQLGANVPALAANDPRRAFTVTMDNGR